MKASGTFEVRLGPLDTHVQGVEGMQLGRLSIDKAFHGDLQGSSRGEMLSARTPVAGSAGYVALEQVVGALAGKQGSFLLQHFGTMSGGDQRLILEVVPDSATGQLQGLVGVMFIKIEQGRHFYEFAYELSGG